MESQTLTSKQLLSKFFELNSIEKASSAEWRKQATLLKRLLNKFTPEQINYALEYYSAHGTKIYSLGYLSKALSEKLVEEQKAQQFIQEVQTSDTERNQRKLRESNETRSGEKFDISRFKKSESDY